MPIRQRYLYLFLKLHIDFQASDPSFTSAPREYPQTSGFEGRRRRDFSIGKLHHSLLVSYNYMKP
jgi:outer membrane receptor for Fe3+-dicitrate